MVECAWKSGDPGYVVLDRINKSGGINGRPVSLIVVDDEYPARGRGIRLTPSRGVRCLFRGRPSDR